MLDEVPLEARAEYRETLAAEMAKPIPTGDGPREHDREYARAEQARLEAAQEAVWGGDTHEGGVE